MQVSSNAGRLSFRLAVGVSAFVWLTAAPGRADFVPGRVYMSAFPVESCFTGGADIIYELDPVTGAAREFASFPCHAFPSQDFSGMAFTPDGSRLRVSAYWPNAILEFDDRGQGVVALDARHGISRPGGSNNLAYDSDGAFYVVNSGAREILQFAPGAGTAVLYGDLSTGVEGRGPIAVSAHGTLYYAAAQGRSVVKFTSPMNSIAFDTLPVGDGVVSLTVDRAGNLYILTWNRIYAYANGDPTSRRVLAPFEGINGASTILVAPEGEFLYASHGGELFAIDLLTGASRRVATTPLVPGIIPGGGIAVSIPEPPSLALMTLMLLRLRQPHTRRASRNSIRQGLRRGQLLYRLIISVPYRGPRGLA